MKGWKMLNRQTVAYGRKDNNEVNVLRTNDSYNQHERRYNTDEDALHFGVVWNILPIQRGSEVVTSGWKGMDEHMISSCSDTDLAADTY